MALCSSLDVLLALVGTTPEEPLGGDRLLERLRLADRPVGADRLLRLLLDLEQSRHVVIDRRGGYGFALTELGEDSAYDLGPGDSVDLTIVMVDLVGYVAFTDQRGDEAGLRAALELAAITRDELTRRSGRVVKQLGDGILGSLPAGADPVGALSDIARRCNHDGSSWPVRAAARRGRPISHAGDLFGGDVNLTARLCAAAAPGEALLSGFSPTALDEQVEVRGLSHPVAVTRVALR